MIDYIPYDAIAVITKNSSIFKKGERFRVILKDRNNMTSILVLNPDPRYSFELGLHSEILKIVQKNNVSINEETRAMWLTNWGSYEKDFHIVVSNKYGCKHDCQCEEKCEFYEEGIVYERM